MKEKLIKCLRALYSKPVLLAVIIALLGALGLTADPDKVAQIVCLLPGVGGC